MENGGVNGGGRGLNEHPKQLSAESQPLFKEGIYLVLSRWSALHLAIENEWGGRGSGCLADQLASDIFSWFAQPRAEPLYIDDLEDILEEGMLSLNTMIEDGSIEEVAEKLMIMHEECLEGNCSSIEKLRQAGPSTGIHQHIRQATEHDEDEDDDDDDNDSMGNGPSSMTVDAPELQSKTTLVYKANDGSSAKDTQLEDGWTVVSANRNRGKRN
uniref:Uncharacterized protein MANES_08G120700 n=1 Tax=Rhizophora mucronata TaxID=61149 RepID=A0A2P2NHJ2_RHIMU